MSDLNIRPEATLCEPVRAPGPVAELYPAREVPLGGVRGVYVERTLPQRQLPTVGAWCFLDNFGSPTAAVTGSPPNIDPHPHIGLQTVTWPLEGLIRHRDSVGSDVQIAPNQLNLMTSGRGIAHSEYPVPDSPAGRGLQFWVALPNSHRQIAPHFEQHRELPVHTMPGLRATVLMGALSGIRSPALTYTPLVGADIEVESGCSTELPLDPAFEHAILLMAGEATAAGSHLTPGPLLYLGTGRSELAIASGSGARFVLIGGTPLDEQLVMWWNFVGRSHAEIAAARTDWVEHNTQRFGEVAGHLPGQRIPAPPLPGGELKPRVRQPRR